ncbi:MAG: hypothetical protein HUJ26_19930 [Planctomycetaceae bacterium]|nr:hypothetical protein [Planctomycetaceae bacterium]
MIQQAIRLKAQSQISFDDPQLCLLIQLHDLKEQLLKSDIEIDLRDFRTEKLTESKSKDVAQYVLKAARLDLQKGQLKAAREKALAVQAMEVRFGLFDDTPGLLLQDIDHVSTRLHKVMRTD